jgi:hypothetical protein
MAEHNVEGNPDQRRFHVLQSNFDFNHKRHLDTIKQRDNLNVALAKEQLAYVEECFVSSRQLGTLVIPAVGAIRRELELPINETLYGRVMDQLFEKQQAAIDQFIAEMRNLVERAVAVENSKPDVSKEV